MANTYRANPQEGVRALEEIESLRNWVADLMRDFERRMAPTTGWPGQDDSYSKTAKPHEVATRTNAVKTGETVVGTLDGILESSRSTFASIKDTQEESMDTVRRAAGGMRGRGR
ncbi:hypothetical protein ACIOWI_34895 [Streptomyces sp. NPDC087659]|uniref:hypothetical protein n=1 Tax=Streptomyces sp. NPDC087659 TaxID=3365801 RepID=UPI0038278E19